MSFTKENSGITLVALVVTIIVLIILSAITIIAIANDGIIDRATKAKDVTHELETKEKIELEILGSYNEYGKIEKELLKKNLSENIPNIIIENDEFPIRINAENKKMYIYEDGKLTEISYEEKEYLKSTGTQYIDTGVNPSDTINFEMVFKTDVNAMTISNTGRNAMFGAGNKTSNKTIAFNFGDKKGQSSIFMWKNNTYANGAKIISFSTSTYNPTQKIKVSSKNDIWKVNDKIIGTSESVGEWKDMERKLIIFGEDTSKGVSIFYETLYLYSLKIWDNEKLIRDFIPVCAFERKSNGESCLLDLVEEKFYYNLGEGEFE